jgi:hypothetical protein
LGGSGPARGDYFFSFFEVVFDEQAFAARALQALALKAHALGGIGSPPSKE